ncbi:hypothetical protein [uncultured Sphingomonas sp.]|uniref:hypothetical protein n=1 Tax=uncultured Sphingomonas sp. TaxID=158754 RepID=UPI0035CB4F21
MADRDLAGRTAIVTGGGTGIGAAVVRRLAARDVSCVINYAHSQGESVRTPQCAHRRRDADGDGDRGGGYRGTDRNAARPREPCGDGETLLVDAGAHLDVGLSRRPGREGWPLTVTPAKAGVHRAAEPDA